MSLHRALTQNVDKTFKALGPLVRPATYEAHTGLVFRHIEEGFTIPQVVEYPLKRVAFTGFQEKEIDGKAVIATDQKIIFPAAELPVEPFVGDCVKDCRGATWRVIERFDSPGSLIVRAHVRLQARPNREICVPPPDECPSPPCQPLPPLKTIYWGVVATDALGPLDVISLPNKASRRTLANSFTYAAADGDYLWYAFPVSFGKPDEIRERAPYNSASCISFKVSVVTVTDTDGNTEPYYVWRIKKRAASVDIVVSWS